MTLVARERCIISWDAKNAAPDPASAFAPSSCDTSESVSRISRMRILRSVIIKIKKLKKTLMETESFAA